VTDIGSVGRNAMRARSRRLADQLACLHITAGISVVEVSESSCPSRPERLEAASGGTPLRERDTALTRVLVVEDERITAFHLRQTLERLGYSVPGVMSNGRETLARVAGLKPDLILMDIHLEGDIDGIETASRLREASAVPVIYLSAYGEEAVLRRARATSPYGFLLKPFSERELHATIQMGLERSLVERSLLALTQRFRDFSRIASVWFWELDEEYRFRWVSDSPSIGDRIVEACELGKTRWEIVARGVTAAEWEAHRARLDARLPILDFRFETVDASGCVHHLSVSGDPVFDSSGRFQGYRGVGHDITLQFVSERMLSMAKEEAESASRFKSQFLANMSHELRTPLNAILGFSEMIRDETIGPVAPRYRGYASDIVLAGRHLLRVINDVLDLSKVESGRMELREESVDLIAMIVACCRMLQARADDASIALRVRMGADLPNVLADPMRLQQVLLNLLANAVKFTPAGGSVTVDATASVDAGVRISIADTGIGMNAEDIPTALKPFRQLEMQQSRRYEGTGLGLPIAKMLIELHGGTLGIESEIGRGTIVTIHLPPARLVA